MRRDIAVKSIQALISIFAALVLALAVWNVALGLVVGKSAGYREHPVLGRILRPGDFIQSEEGFCRTHIDSLGFRNAEIGPKRPGRSRVLCLGDSFTAGFQVEDGQTYVDGLRRCLGPNVEVINGGRDGVSPAAHLFAADFYHQTLSPDLVVFEISPNNLKGQMADPAANFYAVPEGAEYRVVRNEGYVGDSLLLQRFTNLGRLGSLASVPCVKIGVHNLSLMIKSPAMEGRAREREMAPPELCRWTVRALHDRFPRLVLVYVGQPAYFESAPADQESATLSEEAKRLGVPFLDVTPILAAHFLATGQLANGFSNSEPGRGHINGLGHRLLAEALAPLVQRML